jgi:hypothetical protein
MWRFCKWPRTLLVFLDLQPVRVFVECHFVAQQIKELVVVKLEHVAFHLGGELGLRCLGHLENVVDGPASDMR